MGKITFTDVFIKRKLNVFIIFDSAFSVSKVTHRSSVGTLRLCY